MKYEINFDNNAVEKKFLDVDHYYTWSERNFEDKDLARNVACTITFENAVKELRLFGANVDVGSYNDNGFLRIGFARINTHEFVKNGKINLTILKDALWEIAHPENN
jgi:hypothetical protein